MKLLDRLSECLDSSAARNVCLEQFRASGKMSSGSAAQHAAGTLASIRELCCSHGIKFGEITDEEIARFVKDSSTKSDGYFCATEYQELVNKIAKYAALKARRHPRARWALGVAFSAAGAVAVSAVLPGAAAASTGLMVAAAPVGAAVGAVALSLDSRSRPRRDRKRATRHVPRKPKAPAAAEISAAEQDSTVLTSAAMSTAAAPAGLTEAQLAASSGSEELISAVVEVGSTAASPAKAAPQPASLASPTPSAFAAAAAAADEPAMPLLPDLVRCASPAAPNSSSSGEAAASTEDSIAQPGTPGTDVDAAAFDGAVTAGLPPLAVKPKGKDQKPVSGTKALKKGLSKSFKSVKKAFSMNSTGSGSLRSSLDITSPNGSITTPSSARPPLPTSGAAAFLRRSFSRDSRDVAVVADKDGSLLVQPSEGSATLRKMRDALRRSFTISTPRSASRRASVDNSAF